MLQINFQDSFGIVRGFPTGDPCTVALEVLLCAVFQILLFHYSTFFFFKLQLSLTLVFSGYLSHMIG